MGQLMFERKLPINPTPPLLTDYTGLHSGWVTVVGYNKLLPNTLTREVKRNREGEGIYGNVIVGNVTDILK